MMSAVLDTYLEMGLLGHKVILVYVYQGIVFPFS